MRVDDYCHAVIRSTKLGPTAQAVLWAIAYYINRKNGETFVSLSTIAEDTGIGRTQVKHWTAELITAGIFSVEHRSGRSSVYRFPIHPALSTPGRPTDPVDKGDRVGQPTGVGRPADQGWVGQPTTNHVPNHVPNRAAGPVDDEQDPTPGWFKDRIVRHIEAETVDVVDREPPRMMWEVSM